MFQKLKTLYPEKEFPLRLGKKWSLEEDDHLLEEIENNFTNIEIAQNHDRSEHAIECRIDEIAYKMYQNKISIQKIIYKTKISEEKLSKIILKKQNKNKKQKEIYNDQNSDKVYEEIKCIKYELKEINNNISKLFKFLQTLEFIE
jgi:hypothetical protein